MNKKNKIIIGVLAGVIILVGVFLLLKKDATPKEIYEVAVMVMDQNNSNAMEDAKTSLKKGDVLVVQKDGHNWSKTESISYLLLRIEMTEAESQLLTQAKTKELSYKELSEAERSRIDEEKERAEAEGIEYIPEKHEETLLAREYYIDMSNFEGFKAVELISKQPYLEEVYDWDIVAKKK